MKNRKQVGHVVTTAGFGIKVYGNKRTGVVIPTNWKQQASILAGPPMITKRMANRRARKIAARAYGLAMWKKSKDWSHIPALLAKAGLSHAL